MRLKIEVAKFPGLGTTLGARLADLVFEHMEKKDNAFGGEKSLSLFLLEVLFGLLNYGPSTCIKPGECPQFFKMLEHRQQYPVILVVTQKYLSGVKT